VQGSQSVLCEFQGIHAYVSVMAALKFIYFIIKGIMFFFKVVVKVV